MIKKLFYLGLLLGIARVIIGAVIYKFISRDVSYFFDIFIFAYLYIWFFFVKITFSLKHIILMNIFIAFIAIIVHDLYVIISKDQNSFKLFFLQRSVVALNILFISTLSSVCYFLTQRFLLHNR
jgi:hypothetical protein